MVALLLGIAALAGCGGSTKTEFQDKEQFELNVAYRLGVDHVDCEKTSDTTAKCRLPDAKNVYIACESADSSGGKNCSITEQRE